MVHVYVVVRNPARSKPREKAPPPPAEQPRYTEMEEPLARFEV